MRFLPLIVLGAAGVEPAGALSTTHRHDRRTTFAAVTVAV